MHQVSRGCVYVYTREREKREKRRKREPLDEGGRYTVSLSASLYATKTTVRILPRQQHVGRVLYGY